MGTNTGPRTLLLVGMLVHPILSFKINQKDTGDKSKGRDDML